MRDRRAGKARRSVVLLTVALLTGVGACVGPDFDEPPIVRVGVDACDRCRMIVSDERYAAARWLPDEVAFARYDDIGCLLADLASGRRRGGEGGEAPGGVWVHDHGTGQWIDARTAAYVRAENLETPMASGLAAFAETEAARAFAAGFGASGVLTWAEVREPPGP